MDGVGGVQAFCRPNRILDGYDKKTLIAAFYNTYDEIIEMFDPFYDGGVAEPTVNGISEIRKAYTRILSYGVIDKFFVEEFAGKYWHANEDKKDNIGNKQSLFEYNAIFSELCHRVDNMPIEVRYAFRSAARAYCNNYNFIKLTTRIDDRNLAAMHIIAEKIKDHKVSLPPKKEDYEVSDIADRLSINSVTCNNETHSGESPFDNEDMPSVKVKQAPVGRDDIQAETNEKLQAKKRLSEIITELNSLGVIDEKDEVINVFDALVYDAMLDPEIKQSAVVNDYADFDSEFNRIVRQKLVKSATTIKNKSLKCSIMSLLRNSSDDNTYERVMSAFTKVKIRCWQQSREAGGITR